jgi:hypothetical protein
MKHDAPKAARSPDAIDIAQIAAEAQADVRTVLKRIRGERVRGMSAGRIDRELRKRGFEPGPAAEGPTR